MTAAAKNLKLRLMYILPKSYLVFVWRRRADPSAEKTLPNGVRGTILRIVTFCAHLTACSKSWIYTARYETRHCRYVRCRDSCRVRADPGCADLEHDVGYCCTHRY